MFVLENRALDPVANLTDATKSKQIKWIKPSHHDNVMLIRAKSDANG